MTNQWNGPKGWKHEVGTFLYETEDGRGQVLVRSAGFAKKYDAYVDGKCIGTRTERGLAMRLVELSK